jgi:hypothetical protein
MQVGTTLPQMVVWGTGMQGKEPMEGFGDTTWTCNFNYLSIRSTWAPPKQVSWGLSRLVQTPGGFTCRDYLGWVLTYVPRSTYLGMHLPTIR